MAISSSSRRPTATRPSAVGTVLLALCSTVIAVALWASPVHAAAIETAARQAILIDMTTGSVLFEKNADERMPTSSMSKIMTMYMVFEALRDGRLSLDDELPVSEKAWRMEGSKMFVEVGKRVRVEDLIRGVIVQSGNDATVVFAEALGGSEEEFGRRMTERAHELGMTNSNFVNASGWPHPDHYSTARDLAVLAMHLVRDFPEDYEYFSELEFTYGQDLNGRPITQGNRNPLLYRDIGVDGLKTGHTEAAGYGLTASAEREGRRLVLVVNGLPSVNARAEEGDRLLSWGFREFETVDLFAANQAVAPVEIWMGDPQVVPMVVAEDLAITVGRADRSELKVVARVEEPVPAPVAAGDRIGTLVISMPNLPDREVPLLAGAASEPQGFFGRVVSAAGYYASQFLE